VSAQDPSRKLEGGNGRGSCDSADAQASAPPRLVRRRVTIEAVVMTEPTEDRADQAAAYAAVADAVSDLVVLCLQNRAGLMGIRYPLVSFTAASEPLGDGERT
jgi:hypothetical protein